jgi:predicted small metal-binding protein
MAAEHARKVHGVTEITPEIANKIKAAIKEQ